jgi:hypothetical protein
VYSVDASQRRSTEGRPSCPRPPPTTPPPTPVPHQCMYMSLYALPSPAQDPTRPSHELLSPCAGGAAGGSDGSAASTSVGAGGAGVSEATGTAAGAAAASAGSLLPLSSSFKAAILSCPICRAEVMPPSVKPMMRARKRSGLGSLSGRGVSSCLLRRLRQASASSHAARAPSRVTHKQAP